MYQKNQLMLLIIRLLLLDGIRILLTHLCFKMWMGIPQNHILEVKMRKSILVRPIDRKQMYMLMKV